MWPEIVFSGAGVTAIAAIVRLAVARQKGARRAGRAASNDLGKMLKCLDSTPLLLRADARAKLIGSSTAGHGAVDEVQQDPETKRIAIIASLKGWRTAIRLNLREVNLRTDIVFLKRHTKINFSGVISGFTDNEVTLTDAVIEL